MDELRKRASEEFENSVRKTCNIDFVIPNAMIILPYNTYTLYLLVYKPVKTALLLGYSEGLG